MQTFHLFTISKHRTFAHKSSPPKPNIATNRKLSNSQSCNSTSYNFKNNPRERTAILLNTNGDSNKRRTKQTPKQ